MLKKLTKLLIKSESPTLKNQFQIISTMIDHLPSFSPWRWVFVFSRSWIRWTVPAISDRSVERFSVSAPMSIWWRVTASSCSFFSWPIVSVSFVYRKNWNQTQKNCFSNARTQRFSSARNVFLPSGNTLTFTPPESFPSGQFWGIYALIGGVRVKAHNFFLGFKHLDCIVLYVRLFLSMGDKTHPFTIYDSVMQRVKVEIQIETQNNTNRAEYLTDPHPAFD